jgi:hypothetical protein
MAEKIMRQTLLVVLTLGWDTLSVEGLGTTVARVLTRP